MITQSLTSGIKVLYIYIETVTFCLEVSDLRFMCYTFRQQVLIHSIEFLELFFLLGNVCFMSLLLINEVFDLLLLCCNLCFVYLLCCLKTLDLIFVGFLRC